MITTEPLHLHWNPFKKEYEVLTHLLLTDAMSSSTARTSPNFPAAVKKTGRLFPSLHWCPSFCCNPPVLYPIDSYPFCVPECFCCIRYFLEKRYITNERLRDDEPRVSRKSFTNFHLDWNRYSIAGYKTIYYIAGLADVVKSGKYTIRWRQPPKKREVEGRASICFPGAVFRS